MKRRRVRSALRKVRQPRASPFLLAERRSTPPAGSGGSRSCRRRPATWPTSISRAPPAKGRALRGSWMRTTDRCRTSRTDGAPEKAGGSVWMCRAGARNDRRDIRPRRSRLDRHVGPVGDGAISTSPARWSVAEEIATNGAARRNPNPRERVLGKAPEVTAATLRIPIAETFGRKDPDRDRERGQRAGRSGFCRGRDVRPAPRFRIRAGSDWYFSPATRKPPRPATISSSWRQGSCPSAAVRRISERRARRPTRGRPPRLRPGSGSSSPSPPFWWAWSSFGRSRALRT